MAEKPKEKEYRQCARCHYVNEKEFNYCIQCAAPLLNRCTDEKGLLSKGCNKVNPPEAAYCRFCGEPTMYYKLGIVRAFSDD